MQVNSPWTALLLALLLSILAALVTLSTCSSSTYDHAYAHAQDKQPCESDLPGEPLMSSLPLPEIYEVGVEYPSLVREKAVKWAKVFEVPASWLISLGYVESRNQPLAKNKSGATGAIQIKPARAKDLVTWLSRSKWKAHQMVQEILLTFWHGMSNDLLNLDLNVMLAAFELHRLRRRFGDNHEIVHAAYNQGEGRISRCLAKGLPLPPRAIEFIARVRRARQLGYV
jgi:soluble lytic murein transglycosylase-like protein